MSETLNLSESSTRIKLQRITLRSIEAEETGSILCRATG